MELKQLFERTVEIRQATPLPNVKQRMAEVAAEMSRAGDNQARVELLNEACLALSGILYITEPDGRLANVDHRTHRLLVPAPWGKAGWKRWGLRDWEATILRKILIMRSEMRRVMPVFDYNSESGQWYLNVKVYPRLDAALDYWRRNPITLRDWRLYADAYRQDAQARMAKVRNTLGSP